MKLMALDFETTGVDPWNDRPVSVALVFDPGTSFSYVLNCGVEVPLEAAQIHGITTERVRKEGVDPADKLAYLARQIEERAWEDVPLCIMNARFDWPLFLTELGRWNIPAPQGVSFILDPSLLDKYCDKYRKGKRTLTDLCRHYGVELKGAHGAAADALATINLVRTLYQKFPVLRNATLGQLVKIQKETSAEYIDFLNKRREPEKLIEHGWPIPNRK